MTHFNQTADRVFTGLVLSLGLGLIAWIPQPKSQSANQFNLEPAKTASVIIHRAETVDLETGVTIFTSSLKRQ
ncbi:MAG: hypothetical protein HC825_06130 [Oscillatoriales cyanobacterium RM1_1_9]|nr:hypothetical protein [Oscillatoriales cyanobacterium SM2_3_0]NJO44466.1 hypothetical protein [Oscillatoriales cyanobacterium RM2_1_1]NJO71375.1 hypothetical protein [Oscillatoriales cyanobacterium RM1_1_9]